MSSENSATVPQDASAAQGASVPAQAKGKGKAPATEEPVDTTMDEDDDDDEEDEDEVSFPNRPTLSCLSSKNKRLTIS